MTNCMMRGSRSGAKGKGQRAKGKGLGQSAESCPDWRLGQREASLAPRQGWADRPGPAGLGPSRPSPRPRLLYVGSLASWMFPPSACKSMSSVSLRIGHNSLSCKIPHFSGQVLGVCRLLDQVPGFSELSLLHCMTCMGLQGLVMRCLMNLYQKSCIQR
jgi:hypothetical protein